MNSKVLTKKNKQIPYLTNNFFPMTFNYFTPLK